MPMQPNPSIETSRPLVPNVRVCMAIISLVSVARAAKVQSTAVVVRLTSRATRMRAARVTPASNRRAACPVAFTGVLVAGVRISHCRRYGTTTALARSTRASAVSPTTVTPVAPVSPSLTTRTSALLPSIVSSVTRPWPSAWISVWGPRFAARRVAQRHRRLDLHDRAGAAVRVHGNAEDLAR